MAFRIASSTAFALQSFPRCNNSKKRVDRSTSVPTALAWFAPIMRSPSQCPGTARSSTSAGRSEIITISGILPRLSLEICLYKSDSSSVALTQFYLEKKRRDLRQPETENSS